MQIENVEGLKRNRIRAAQAGKMVHKTMAWSQGPIDHNNLAAGQIKSAIESKVHDRHRPTVAKTPVSLRIKMLAPMVCLRISNPERWRSLSAAGSS